MVYGGIPPEERTKRAMAALTLVHIAEKANNLSNHISGGQIQRVAIARALVMDPSILLADEPTGNLDPYNAERVLELFFHLQELHKTSVVMVTHDPAIAKRVQFLAPYGRNHQRQNLAAGGKR